jgi:formate dehydrogenase major subunit
MELGEPDASGRRRPVPVEGSDFVLKVDYILAAIGQKTDVNFIDDINKHTSAGQLFINKWGDIDADKNTLQTGIPSVFAAGDGVTGPATIIEAIAQARIASTSAHQFIMGLPVIPLKKPFTSKRENFRKQAAKEYLDRFEKQMREEMPTLSAGDRMNFREVELGYTAEEVAFHETQRCLECGCTAFFNCDLQKYSSDYNASQKAFEGEFREYQVDFRHPYIEIDNNKCILCARCVRICREVVGANALGLINRGFDTFVAPSMGDALQDSHCESCGMCISTCPTGAITENVNFKPGPVRTKPVETICNYCSIGCSVDLNTVNGYVFGVSGKKGMVNTDGNICRYPKFGYNHINDTSRVTRPLLKENGKFREISFEEAFALIRERLNPEPENQTALFAGARLSNEEMYLVHKLARLALKTNNVGSFHYLGRGESYRDNCENNTPFAEIRNAGLICYIGTEINRDHAVAGFMAQNAHYLKKTSQLLVTIKENNSMAHKVDSMLRIRSYYSFIKAVNHYILSKGLENGLFLRDRVGGFGEYKKQLLGTDFPTLLEEAGVSSEQISAFAENYNKEQNAIIIFSEKEISGAASKEIFNLAMITGKLGKTASGIISLREKNNSQGLFDMGVSPHFGIGGQSLVDAEYTARLKQKWESEYIAAPDAECLHGKLRDGKLRNLIIFGEDPIGCAIDKKYAVSLFTGIGFLVVQDYFLTETATQADLVLPASLPAETGGSFTNSQKIIQQFGVGMKPRVELNNLQQLKRLLQLFGFDSSDDPAGLFLEAVCLLPVKNGDPRLNLIITEKDNQHRRYNYGCDAVMMRFEKEFEDNIGNRH